MYSYQQLEEKLNEVASKESRAYTEKAVKHKVEHLDNFFEQRGCQPVTDREKLIIAAAVSIPMKNIFGMTISNSDEKIASIIEEMENENE